jgi:molybdopterin synthase sulfur carrier subunit
MKVKVLLFGVLADKAGISFVVVENTYNLNDLLRNLKTRFPFLEKASYAVARNQEIVRGNTELIDNDEIALLPPFAGG